MCDVAVCEMNAYVAWAEREAGVLASRWVVGVSDAESWLPFDETQPFDDASAALAWVEEYLRCHPTLFANHPSRGFTCKKMAAPAEGFESNLSGMQGEAHEGLPFCSVSEFFPHRSALVELASLGA